VCVCVFQFVKKAVIPVIMELHAPRAQVHVDQYQGMRPHLMTVIVSRLTCYNFCAISSRVSYRFVSVTAKQTTPWAIKKVPLLFLR